MLTLYLTCLVVGGVFVSLSAVGAIGKDMDAHHDGDHAELEHAGDGDHEVTVADGSHALVPHRQDPPKRWLPFLSFRFWTFGSAFFGLTGTLLSMLTASAAPMVAVASAGTGIGVGTLSAWMVRWLRRPVGASIRLADYVGSVGELVLPLREGGITRIKLHVQERERTMLAVAVEPLALPAGTKVVVLGIDETGRAKIEPEQTAYGTEE
jgi:hypothetical protein